jgi:class 3 adenylate cyclase
MAFDSKRASTTSVEGESSAMSESLHEWAGVTGNGARATLAIVFTDIIDSTDLARELGDATMYEMLVKHFEYARNACDTYNGYEVKLIGDAYMAAFRNADDALQFGKLFWAVTGDSRIAIRVGIHVGQVRIKDNDIYGLQVNLAARLSHVEVRGETGIFVSTSAKRDIESEYGSGQKDVRFGGPLPVRLKGFDGREGVWQVITEEIMRARRKRQIAKREETARAFAATKPVTTRTPQIEYKPQEVKRPDWADAMKRRFKRPTDFPSPFDEKN